jgi:hypothetical protein
MAIKITGSGGSFRLSGTGGGMKVTSSGGGGSGGGSPIVSSGLILHLDAGNPASYPGSGTTWTDLSGNGKHATLYNSPTYSATNGGIVSFSKPSTQYAAGPALGAQTEWTICMWVRRDADDPSGSEQFFTDETSPSGNGSVNYCLGHLYSTSGVSTNTYVIGNNWFGTSGSPFSATLGAFYFLVGMKDSAGFKLYSNNSLVASSAAGAIGGLNGLEGYRIASKWTGYASPVYLSCTVGSVAFYNRALNTSELTQNWDATRTRFGL